MNNEKRPTWYSINDHLTVAIREEYAPWAQPACKNAELFLTASLTEESDSLLPKSEDCSFVQRGIQPVRDAKGMLSFSNILMKQYGNRLGLCTTGQAAGCFAYELPASKGDIPLKWGYINNYLFWDFTEAQDQIAPEYHELQTLGYLKNVSENQYLRNPYRGMWIILRPLLMNP